MDILWSRTISLELEALSTIRNSYKWAFSRDSNGMFESPTIFVFPSPPKHDDAMLYNATYLLDITTRLEVLKYQ